MPKRDLAGDSKVSVWLEDAIAQMKAGKYGRSSAALNALLPRDPHHAEARRLATLHLRIGGFVTARQAFESLVLDALGRQDFELAESLLREYLAAGPRCVPFRELLALVYEENGDTQAAVAELGQAIGFLIEDPIPEDFTKPAELYAKVRALEPASPVAFQFAHLFDGQTGELLAPQPVDPSSVTSGAVATTNDASESCCTSPDQMPSGLARQEVQTSLPESEGPTLEGNRADQELLSSSSDQVNREKEPVAPETSPTVAPAFTDQAVIASRPAQASVALPLSTVPGDGASASPAVTGTVPQWSTGDVAVQTHRPSTRKQNWDKEKGEVSMSPSAPVLPVEESSELLGERSRSGGWEAAPSEAAVPAVEAVAPVVEQAVPQEEPRPELAETSDSITLPNLSQPPSVTWQDAGIESVQSNPEPVTPVAAQAGDLPLDSTEQSSQARTENQPLPAIPFCGMRERVVLAGRGFSSRLVACLVRTQSLFLFCVWLVLSCAAIVTVCIGMAGLAWMVMEEPPSSAYLNLTTSAPQMYTDPGKNGYFLLLGFEAPAERDPLQAGQGRKMEGSDLQAAQACLAGDASRKTEQPGASSNAARRWFDNADPAAKMKGQADAARSRVTQESMALIRYQQWLSMPFADGGYGGLVSPNCAHILLAHRLYLAEGFTQSLSAGLSRLETDMESWRVALGRSRTLMVKMLATTAIEDDVALASGLLLRQDLDGPAIGRLSKIVRPLDQEELSLRWPMRSHFLWATNSVTSSLKQDKTNGRPLSASLAAMMPLPLQRRANAYADYYEAASHAVTGGRYTHLPKRSDFVRTPAVSLLDYLANPVEHIVGIEPLPSWDSYVGRLVEADARLRLASLQAWIRQSTQEGTVFTRLAKAGQSHYDPFTGLPMLVNQQKGVIYSVGQDGQDQDGDPRRDIVATIPLTRPSPVERSRASSLPR
ncbi:MAG: tetratricopeptide repeat protein [Nitrospirae bacterium]|nr:tetratricopeptide repeat protein [Nitrospirota bacterium]